MEVAGFVVGVLPLAAQLFQSTLILYSQYSDAQDVGKTSTKYRTFLQIERHRYENVGVYIGLTSQGQGAPAVRLSPATLNLILDILAQIAQALLETQKLERKYSFHNNSSPSRTETSASSSAPSPPPDPLHAAVSSRLERHVVIAQEVKKSVSLISSLRFAVWDKPKFEQFIVDLRNLNDGLENVTGYQAQLRSQLMVQMLDVKAIQDLSALSIATAAVYPTLSEMAKRKAAYLDMRDRQLQKTAGGPLQPGQGSELKLDYCELVMRKEAHPTGRTFGTYKGTPIMVEWRLITNFYDESISRVQDMVMFLAKSSVAQDDTLSPSHLLGCMG
ncbi:uncharacterized protein H6S33_010670 [Morchella sextelata]|uniref:uncharacterized protein n=1 Tax=Morchella sextelata TaxID=1174677 RepID=UPI001D036F35|nr:uncharacterized protein H6S33_010670 [Morchella sextelata]KAH0611405.1 hypothetical protein H6S33_010670 [Morchella sextelata]